VTSYWCVVSARCCVRDIPGIEDIDALSLRLLFIGIDFMSICS
jgi:hypothetical protein